MSKAFTKESDDSFDEIIPEPKEVLPPGVRNYVTPEGAAALRRELAHFVDEVRPQIAASKDDIGGSSTAPKVTRGAGLSRKKRLEAIDRHIQLLKERISGMEVVDPASQDPQTVRFGATVTVADAEGVEKVYKIVGVDESDPAAGKISWISPIARALISARESDVVILELPAGDVELEIVDIAY